MAEISRDVPIDPAHAALLIIDMQNYNAHPDGAEYAGWSEAERAEKLSYLFRTLRDTAVPNMRRLQAACRKGGIEVLQTVIESLTLDGRDRSLDYKISGIPKTSSSVFISTNIDYVLRNLGVRSLIIAGMMTDQCIDSAVRDACDLGYLVTTATDACATASQERHDWSLRNAAGYSRQRTTAQLVEEIERLTS
jgi:ureidoacrylate peracid hydrolase